MTIMEPIAARTRLGLAMVALGLVSGFAVISTTRAADPKAKVETLLIGSSGTLTGAGTNEKGALESLQDFIKEETEMKNEIQKQKNWQELADKLAKGQLHLGVFQGFEFAWAKGKVSGLTPLALAIHVDRYPVAYVIVQKDNPTKDMSGLEGKTMALPSTGQGYLRLYVERLVNGKKAEEFFGKVTSPGNFEDALDDVVDGVVQAAVADRGALEAYKRRKPARFNKLKPLVHSQLFPPTVVAYYDTVLDESTLQRFRQGLLNAANTERGKTMLTLFRLTRFEPVPADFDKILSDTRKQYPSNGAGK
jgi:ABC-type phosphate/phosphonate transport system substrate-binding protein